MSKKIVITGGGTGGHVFPALAISQELKNRGFEVLYVGSDRGLEASLAPKKGIRFLEIQTGGVKNQSPLHIIKTIFKVLKAIWWSIGLLRNENASAIIGVGGYVSVPVCLAGVLLRIPVYLQEQNVTAGIANRLIGKFARCIFTGFEGAEEWFPKNRTILTGNPLREEFYAKEFSPPTFSPPSLLILGGSQGARAINQIMESLLEPLAAKYPDIRVVHQTGKSDYKAVESAYEKSSIKNFQVSPFIDDMVMAFEQASVVAARSGALTVSELTVAKRPAIFIPYPRKGKNDQTANAYQMESKGVARVVEQGPRFQERFWATFTETLQPQVLENMHKKFLDLPQRAALATIGDRIQSDLK